MIVGIADAVLVGCAVAIIMWLVSFLLSHGIPFRRSPEDCVAIAVLFAAVAVKLVQWCTPWL